MSRIFQLMVSKGIIYQAKVTSEGKTRTYVGLAATECKGKFRNHAVAYWVVC